MIYKSMVFAMYVMLNSFDKGNSRAKGGDYDSVFEAKRSFSIL